MRKLKAESNKQEPTAMYPVPFHKALFAHCQSGWNAHSGMKGPWLALSGMALAAEVYVQDLGRDDGSLKSHSFIKSNNFGSNDSFAKHDLPEACGHQIFQSLQIVV